MHPQVSQIYLMLSFEVLGDHRLAPVILTIAILADLNNALQLQAILCIVSDLVMPCILQRSLEVPGNHGP